ncbi:MAG: hypothetical protein B7X58_03970, partial [Marinobacter sp. 34-60-7]
GMGVLPLQFKPGDSWESLGLRGDETIDVVPHPELKPQSDATLTVDRYLIRNHHAPPPGN